jgi:cyanophycinase-like exopeptidase
MVEMDEWGKDPSVQIMRRVFNEMEKTQYELLKRLSITPYDLRIKRWRDQALALFERAWGVANRMGITMDENTASVVYVHCLAKVMGAERINIPTGILPEAKSIEKIFKEAFS